MVVLHGSDVFFCMGTQVLNEGERQVWRGREEDLRCLRRRRFRYNSHSVHPRNRQLN